MVDSPPQQGDLERRGPQLWAMLHRWALGADLVGGARWLLQFEWRISCSDCQSHWSQWVREHPADFSSREALFAWTVEAHNAVSRRLGKPQMDVKWAVERWGGLGEGASDASTAGLPEVGSVSDGPTSSPAGSGVVSVNCAHAGPGPKATVARCAIGLYGGTPHVNLCKRCRSRAPRDAGAPAVAVPTFAPAQQATGAQDADSSTVPGEAVPERLILSSRLSPGDILMLTATVRDLHRAYPGRFLTAVETPAPELWEHNPFVSGHQDVTAGWRRMEMEYPLIHQSNQRPLHFLSGYTDYLSNQLGLPIPVSEFRGDIHLTAEEKSWMNQVHEDFGYEGRFWIISAGGKFDFTAKWWPPAYSQRVVDHFLGRVQFVQCGQANHWHPPLRGVFNLIGRTSIRQFVRLMYHADGVVCPVSFAMHLAAAVPTKQDRLRPCVVLAGGREPAHWEAYPGHQFLHTIGALSCCATGGCWKSRCQKVNDGDPKDVNDVCVRPVLVEPELRVAQCMTMVQPSDVIRAIERYLTCND